MGIDLKVLFKFPEDVSEVTTGVLLLEERRLVTGHENGLVVMWNLDNGEFRKLYECSSKIETITLSEKKRAVIGSHLGDVVVMSLADPEDREVLQYASSSTRNRVWSSLWIDNDALVTSSTYGVVNLFEKSPTGWTSKILGGHSDSVFGMGRLSPDLLATGDYVGNILVRAADDRTYRVLQELEVRLAVEGLAWHKDGSFAAINYEGRIFLFEKTSKDKNEWNLVFEVDNATGMGVCISITEDGKTVFAGSRNEIIQFDIENQQIDSVGIKGTKKIFTEADNIYVLASQGLFSFKRKPIEVREDLIKYKYVKIGLVGHTGVGKSTLCSFVTTGEPGDLKTTQGKKVWSWEVPKDDSLDRRVVFHDHGGQETVLSTFLPFIVDSDIILILFQQNDLNTFDKALEILHVLEKNVADNVKIFFVQTYIDQPIDEIDEGTIQDLKSQGRIVDNLLVCPKDGFGVEKLKTRLFEEISWNKARIMIQTASTDAVLQTIMALQSRNTVMTFGDFADSYEKETGLKIPRRHLKFLLRNYSNQGILEYYPEILDLIVFNEPEYNVLRTNIPIFVMKKNGLVSQDEIVTTFHNNRYLPIIDEVYLRYKIAIGNNGLRIFPALLKDTPIKIPGKVEGLFDKKETKKLALPDQEIEIKRLVEALVESGLYCEDASKFDGLFSWHESALTYYRFEKLGNALDGFFVQCTYNVGGRKVETRRRLEDEFLALVQRIFGPFQERREK